MTMMKFRIILFFLSFIATTQVGLAFRTERILDAVEEHEAPETKAVTRIEAPAEMFETDIIEFKVNATVEATNAVEEPETTEAEPESLGEYRITAYCACEKCCGEWALNRPNGIVYGAAGVELKAGVSCASPLPFGTVVEIEGLGEYIVQDRIAQWVIDKYGENLIDIFFDDHEAAKEFGLQYHKIYLKGEVKNG